MAERGDPSESGDLPTSLGDTDPPQSGDPTLSGAGALLRRRSESGEFQSVHALAPGARVGRFVLERKLGEGGMGVVFLARDPELERAVAVKLLRLDRGTVDETNARQRMLREARAMAMLSHPNLVTIYEVGTLADSVFLAMEYVTGQALYEWLGTRHSVEDILSVFDQAGRGLEAMHDAGLVHRDFKPANVVVTDDGLVKVLDLGIARRVAQAQGRVESQNAELRTAPATSERVLFGGLRDEPLTRDGAIVGTPSYMPLEQILGEATSPASDQFAFAVALFEALAGHKPFVGHGQVELLKQVLSEDRRAWPAECAAPPELRAAIDRALARYPEQRFDSVASFLDACWTAVGQAPQSMQRGVASSRWPPATRASDPLFSSTALASEPLAPGAPTIDEAPTLHDARPASRWRQRALVTGLAVVSVALGVTTLAHQRQTSELEAARRAELQASLATVAAEVERCFARAEEHVLFAYDQRRAWLPLFDQLAALDPADRHEGSPLNDLFRPVLERTRAVRWLAVARDDGLVFFVLARSADKESPVHLQSRIERLRLAGSDASFRGHVPTYGEWFRPGRVNTPRVSWTQPYLANSTHEPGTQASVAWQQGSHRYVLALALALTEISDITTQLDPAKFQAFVTTRDHRLLGLPKLERLRSEADIHEFFASVEGRQRAPEAAPVPLPPLSELREGAFATALAVEPHGHRMAWPFLWRDRTLWAGRSFIDRRFPALTVYAIQARPE